MIFVFLCVKGRIMRTNIEINDDLLAQVIELSGAKTKREAIELALKNWVHTLLLQKLEEIRGPGAWEGNLDEMRTVER